MAQMIPEIPREFSDASQEDLIFNALKKLPDDYYVFHSFSILQARSDGHMLERELDFVVANQNKGILCIEAKAGSHISYQNGQWYYSSGELMPHGGPYHQAESAMWAMKNYLLDSARSDVRGLASKCKMLHAVWFLNVASDAFRTIDFPSEADKAITLTADDLANPLPKIERIFEFQRGNLSNNMSEQDFQILLDHVLCPHFHIMQTPRGEINQLELRFDRLLNEQYRILDFLEEQPSAVINGAAGTGKTMLAVEKARRHSATGDKVLFLCFNRLLRDDLEHKYKENSNLSYREQFKNVDFLTIKQLVYRKTGSHSDYDGLMSWLIECIDSHDGFDYKHVIVDEGQDFGLIEGETDAMSDESGTSSDNCSIIDCLQDAALSAGGTFYLFYDKYQMIQGREGTSYSLPDCIKNSDCRLTLHTNCRNTQAIARTSVSPLREKRGNRSQQVSISTALGLGTGTKPVLHFVADSTDQLNTLSMVLDQLRQAQLRDVVILTVKTLNTTGLTAFQSWRVDPQQSSCASITYRGNTYMVTTCRCFKGLEAEAIILVDLEKRTFIEGSNSLLFYVGSSRAKYQLHLLCNLNQEDCYEVAHALQDVPRRNNKASQRRLLGRVLSAQIAE